MCMKGGESVVYKIGDFSNLVNIPIRTLRYYDEIGLLKPEIVDKFTSYRYYTEDNVVEAQFITLLKEVGFTLQEIIDYKKFVNDFDMISKMNNLKEMFLSSIYRNIYMIIEICDIDSLVNEYSKEIVQVFENCLTVFKMAASDLKADLPVLRKKEIETFDILDAMSK